MSIRTPTDTGTNVAPPSPTTPLHASIIIVSYNSKSYLAGCLGAVVQTVPAECEIIVVDNASVDGSADYVAATFPRVHLIRSSRNTGFAEGMNLAVAQATGHYVVGINPDTLAQPGWLDALLLPLESPAVGMTTARIVMLADPTRINTCGNAMHYTGITTCRGLDQPADAPELADMRDVPAVSGACFALRRDIWVELGGFDTTFFTYLEDTDLSLRARLAGYRCVYVPQSVVQHDYANRFSARKLYYLERNRLLLLLKTYRLRTLCVILPALVVASIITWGYALTNGKGSIRALLKAYLWLLTHIGEIRHKRQATQQLRRVSDAQLFAAMNWQLDIGQLAHPGLTKAAHFVLTPFFRLWARAVGVMDRTTPVTAVRPLKIAHISATFPPYRGGTGNVCYHNARELVRRGHAVHVFTAAAPNAPQSDVIEGIHVHRLQPLVRVGNAPVLPGLLAALRGYDVIHLHYPFFGGELATLAALVRHTPLVITYHQDVLLQGKMRIIEKGLRLSAGRITLRSAVRVLFTSADYGRASYVRPLLKGREQATGALANGVDTNQFTPAPASPDLLAHHALTATDRVVLLVAGLDRAHYFKGVDVLLRAITHLPPAVKAVIVGDGDLRESYTAEADRLGIGHRVIFAGRVADAELPDYYRLAHVTVLPSVTMGEAFGLVLLESLLSGTPVIASNLPEVRTVVQPGIDGLLVTPGNSGELAQAITAVLAEESTRQAMGQRGRENVVARYDWSHIGRQLEHIYRDVLHGDEA